MKFSPLILSSLMLLVLAGCQPVDTGDGSTGEGSTGDGGASGPDTEQAVLAGYAADTISVYATEIKPDNGGTVATIVAVLENRNSNQVPDRTKVFFVATAGTLIGERSENLKPDAGPLNDYAYCETVATECSVKWRSSNFGYTGDPLKTVVMAFSEGSDSFTDDVNYDGYYNSGEAFVSYGEPAIDIDDLPNTVATIEYVNSESGDSQERLEPYFDVDGNGSFDATFADYRGYLCPPEASPAPSDDCGRSAWLSGQVTFNKL